MPVGDLSGLLDVIDQISPGGCEALIRLGLRPTFKQGFDDPGCGDLLAAAVENLLLELRNQCLGLAAELNRELSHRMSRDVS
ncbi:hypothetical protein KQ313_01780 [Synechococcus sp. CS-1325]|uniref:hypothetical protein n=1 Tax=Synechococcus sp. CS-1324 TaxID=2847980 RepID=UPI00223BFC67|nr:hypothetical protein [Synechococcus sp. CS-1324]MCT0198417.1 hypothetical protein [Synechococcus sp. CS-1325]MCT0229911.1 hypothetical protein [Synechococcus sp. CS-1324]